MLNVAYSFLEAYFRYATFSF